MRYTQFVLSLLVSTFSYNAYGMFVAEDSGKHPARPLTRSGILPMEPEECEEVKIIALLTVPGAPATLSIDGNTYTHQEYFTMVGATNANCGLGRKYQLERNEIIRENFTKNKRGIYYPKPEFEFTQVFSTKFDMLSQLYSYDTELLYMYARAMKTVDPIKSGYHLARAITIENGRGGGLNTDNITEYLSFWTQFKVKNAKFELLMPKIVSVIDNPQEYLNNNHIRKQPGKAIHNAILDSCELFFDTVKNLFPIKEDTLHNSLYSDASLICLKCLILAKIPDGASLVGSLADRLYTKVYAGVDLNFIPQYIKLDYAFQLIQSPGKNFLKARALCESVLGRPGASDFFQNSDNYNLWATTLVANKEYKKAIPILELALDFAKKPSKILQIEWNIVAVNMLSENYDNSTLEKLKKILRLPFDYRKKHILTSSKCIDSAYECLLARTGHTDELTDLLRDRQEKALEKALARQRAQGQRVQAAVEAQRQLQMAQPRTAITTTIKQNPKKQSARIAESSMVYYNSPANNQEKYVAPEVRVKPKKHGTAIPQIPTTQPTTGAPPKPLLYIEDMTINKNAHRIFYELFSKYRNDVRSDKNVQISLHQIQLLFEALNQDFDASKGHGSHKKGTLNFQEFGSEIEEQMIILTKSIYLKPYQIKQIRKAFIKAGIVPNDIHIIQKLKLEFPDILI